MNAHSDTVSNAEVATTPVESDWDQFMKWLEGPKPAADRQAELAEGATVEDHAAETTSTLAGPLSTWLQKRRSVSRVIQFNPASRTSATLTAEVPPQHGEIIVFPSPKPESRPAGCPVVIGILDAHPQRANCLAIIYHGIPVFSFAPGMSRAEVISFLKTQYHYVEGDGAVWVPVKWPVPRFNT